MDEGMGMRKNTADQDGSSTWYSAELPTNQSGTVSPSQIVKGLKCSAEELGPLTSGTEQVAKEGSGLV